MATSTDANYSPTQEQILRDSYTPTATQAERDEQVKILSEEFGKKKRSIIAKLSRMDLYVAKVRATKTGEPVEHKKDIVAAIAENVGISVTLLTSLSKATKADLQSLAKAVSSS